MKNNYARNFINKYQRKHVTDNTLTNITNNLTVKEDSNSTLH